jgi:hypothetical protein
MAHGPGEPLLLLRLDAPPQKRCELVGGNGFAEKEALRFIAGVGLRCVSEE